MPYYIEHSQEHLERIRKRIKAAVYTPIADLEVTAWCTPEPVPFAKRTTGRKRSLKPGDKWGGLFDCAWFHFTGSVPDAGQGKHVVLLIDVSGEGCVVDAKGVPVRGLTTAIESGAEWSLRHTGKKVVQFAPSAKPGQKVDVWMEAGCNDLLGNLTNNGCFDQAQVAVCNDTLRGLWYDFEVLHDLMKLLSPDSARRAEIMHALYNAQLELKDYDEYEAKRARKILAPILAKRGGDPSLTIHAIGHSHIDLAWLWPIRETIRKAGRTIANIMELYDRYPDFLFGASQAQLYQWVKDSYPELYKKIQKKVKEKRWELQGPMWCETDTNVPCGESLVRQFLYGIEFFRSEFDENIETLWLPDVFGFSAALPQISVKCGMKYFMTQKLCWNQVNVFPHHTLMWEGLDGTQILTHMPPENTYNSDANPASVMKAEAQFKDKGVSDKCLMLFGIGDGGGGPGAEHLERLMRVKNLSGLAPVKQSFSTRLFKELEKDKDLYKTWVGEMYLEYHRGTYTSQARNKWYNRKIELALRQLEANSLVASTFGSGSYPQEKIETIWKELLLYQFHDILPGSSIKRVYDECLERYARMYAETKALDEKARKKYTAMVDTRGFKKPAVVTNNTSFERTEWIPVGTGHQKVTVPAWGHTVIEASGTKTSPDGLAVSSNHIENNVLKVKFRADGAVTSVYDKRCKREVIAKGRFANDLAVYQDQNSGWDIYYDYQHKPRGRFKLEFMENFIDGSRVISRRKLLFGASEIRQDIVLDADSARLDFVTKANWNEDYKMLRTCFPLNLRADHAQCEIQFGNIPRPVHPNTTWEMSKYEVCAHKWVDLAEQGFGCALLNDSKYGHSVSDSAIELNLLRSPDFPDGRADRAKHEFTYSLYPHEGDYRAGKVIEEGYRLNQPLTVTEAKASRGSVAAEHSWITCNQENVFIETLKKAQADDSWIVRSYEGHAAPTKAVFTCGFDVKSVQLVNMIEEKPKKVPVKNNQFKLDFGPFEVHTLRIIPK